MDKDSWSFQIKKERLNFTLKLNSSISIIFIVVVLCISNCTNIPEETRFELIKSDQTGIIFSNDLESKSDFNIINYLYFYDGAGVSIGDINNDGLPDIYFTANMLPNRLYLNRGDFEFVDITDSAGVAGSGDWSTGVTMADVNGDGLLDIYVSNVNYLTKKGRNELFINNGDSTFTEKAEEYGLDFSGYSKQATFFDYNNDGYLDMYLVNHANHSEGSYGKSELRKIKDNNSGDRLYKNVGDRFINVTEKAGIYNSIIGYGLGVAVSDLNNDGCQDLYVSNDFHENDYLYINNCDGTFAEILESSTGHISRSSMGNDVADINNDGHPDIYVADMLPMSEEGLKQSVSSESYKVYKIKQELGYHPQLIQNTLQVNLGNNPEGEIKFAEIAKFSGVHATDWSWATLFFDMDNSGQKDIFVTNGIYRRPNDLDYLLYVRRDVNQKNSSDDKVRNNEGIISKMPQTNINNIGFLNNGANRFIDQSLSLGFGEPSYSSGAAYGDLDNDGDLDLVVNNVNGPASIYKNMTRERGAGNYIQIKLHGNSNNTMGIGGKVMVYDSSSVQFYEMFTTRGFQSSVEPKLTIGLNDANNIDSLRVIWPDKQTQALENVKANQLLTLRQAEAYDSYDYQKKQERKFFNNITSHIGLDYTHKEDDFLDYNQQLLAPFMLSTQGPKLAIGDANNDGLDDFFIGGAKDQAGKVFLQQKEGKFTELKVPVLEEDAHFEDVDAKFFDANGNGLLDLYVASGGNEYSVGSKALGDRLYLNGGEGSFIRMNDALPGIYENGAVIAVADYDNDGDNDLFIGNRSVPKNYGVTPYSYVLENQGKGKFRDVTNEVAPSLKEVGMVTDAVWKDVNEDQQLDLIVVGEWMPVSIFLNKDGELVNSTAESGLNKTQGLWQSIKATDWDNDGDIDFVVGNFGTNSLIKPTEEEPYVLYLKDFNKHGQKDPVIGYTRNGKEYPVAPRDELLTQFKFLRSEFTSYKAYAGKTILEIFSDQFSEGSFEKKLVNTLSSVYIENVGNGKFKVNNLPEKLQWAPIFSFLPGDYNEDGNMELLAGGNFHEVKPSMGGKYDASYGWHTNFTSDGSLEVFDVQKSGFFVEGEVRDIKHLTMSDGESLILVARNNESLLFFRSLDE